MVKEQNPLNRRRRAAFHVETHLPGTAGTLLLGIGLFLLGCSRGHPMSPAASNQKPSSTARGRVMLTSQAEARLGIAGGLAAVERNTVPERRLYSGEVVPVPGRSVLLAAPQSGTVVAVDSDELPASGVSVRAGQPLIGILPLLPPGERAQVVTVLADTEAQASAAAAQDQAAELGLKRAERLVSEGLAGSKLLEEATAQREAARAKLKAAQAQRQALGGGSGARAGLLAALRILSPIDGIIRDLKVALRQQVSAGAPLLEVVGRDVLWVRVPIASSEIAFVARDRAALLGELGTSAAQALLAAPPVKPAPETAQPASGTLDLYFALTDASRFRLGQRLAVWVSRTASDSGLTVPAAALLYDSGGETWVYEQLGPQLYARRRVEVVRLEGERALLRQLKAGTGGLSLEARIVTTGALELLGAEFEVGK